jgi:hypothetical protein
MMTGSGEDGHESCLLSLRNTFHEQNFIADMQVTMIYLALMWQGNSRSSRKSLLIIKQIPHLLGLLQRLH